MSRDPIGEHGGFNLYGFNNNSINRFDLLGLREYTILDIPDIVVTPFQANGFKNTMRFFFLEEYHKGLKDCLSNYIQMLKKCDENGSIECVERIVNHEKKQLTCRENAKFEQIKCNVKMSQWKELSERYSYWRAFVDMFRFDANEAVEYYRKKIEKYEI